MAIKNIGSSLRFLQAIKNFFISKQFFSFIFVGGLNTLFGYAIFALFIYLGMNYAVAVFIATCLGVIFNFKTTGKLVFNSHDNNLIYKFILVYVLLYIFNVLLIKILQPIFENFYLTGFISLMPTAVAAFVLNKYLVFNTRAEKSHTYI